VCALNLNAMARWLRGDVETAKVRANAAIALADELSHPYSQLEACQTALVIALHLRDVSALREHAHRLISLAEADRLPGVAHGYAQGFLGAAECIDGDLDTGLERMLGHAPTWSAFWGAWCHPLDTALASALTDAGRWDEAVSLLEAKLEEASLTQALWWVPEFTRCLATARRLSGEDPSDVTALVHDARDLATRQGSTLLALRAALDEDEPTRSSQEWIDGLRSLAAAVAPSESFPEIRQARDQLN
jgi:hypothetical protein